MADAGMRPVNALRERLTYANVMATLALFIALGGAGYAAINLPRNSVTKKQIAEDAVRASEVAPDSVAGANLIDGSVGAGDIGPDSVDSGKIADGTVGNGDLGGNSVDSGKIGDGSVGPADLASEQGAIGPTLLTCDGGANNWGIGGGSPPGYWMDARQVVHLQGAVTCPGDATEGGAIFTMPAAYRPQTQGTVARFGVLANNTTLAQVAVITGATDAALVYDGPNNTSVDNFVNLDEITYRAVGPVP